MVQNPAWRRAPCTCTVRVASSIARRRIPGLDEPTVPFDEGRSRIVADLRTSLGLRLFRYGVHDPELHLTRLLLQPGDVFVDAGANVGLFALVAAAKVGPAGRVVACEPAPAMRAVLERNARLSGFSWLQAHGVALAERSGCAEFVVFEGEGSGLSSFRPADLDGGKRQTVPVTTLDELVRAEEAPRVSLVKIDVEGAEARVMRGAAGLIARARPDILIEVEEEHLARQGASARELQGIARNAGYGAHRVRWDDAGGVVLVPEDDWTRPSPTPNLFLTADLSRTRTAGIAMHQG
jgi:FkbM family methyltransferase